MGGANSDAAVIIEKDATGVDVTPEMVDETNICNAVEEVEAVDGQNEGDSARQCLYAS